MTRLVTALLAGSALWVGISMPANAAAAAAAADEQVDPQSGETAGEGAGDIVVTARRKEENLQDVPQTINVVTGDLLKSQNTFTFTDLSKLVSGLTFNAAQQSTTLRGVAFNPVAQTTGNVAFYLNEGPIQTNSIFQSLFDVGQVEVLKGPQGTFRGISAPSGAITYYTRKPDLNQWGGSFNATVSNRDARRVEGAISAPIIDGKLAIRLAGLIDRNNNGGVRSVNSSADPFSETTAFRVSLRAEPIDNLSINLMYQRMNIKSLGFGSAVFGTGALGGAAAQSGDYTGVYVQQAGANGPAIPFGSMLAATDTPTRAASRLQIATAQVDYVLGGQKLTYVGSYSDANSTEIGFSGTDTGNLLAGDIAGRFFNTAQRRWTHEGRIASTEPLFGFLDYSAGVFHFREDQNSSNLDGTLQNNGVAFQAGAFGSPLGPPQAITPNYRFARFTRFIRSPYAQETSFFGQLTAHIGSKTEISGGVRFTHYTKDELRLNLTTPGFRAVGYTNAAGTAAALSTAAGRIPVTSASCATIGGTFGTTYANVCDIPVAGVAAAPAVTNAFRDDRVTLFSASVKHNFTENLMAYFNFGTSYRPGPPQGGINNNLNDPYLASLNSLPAERSKSFELGLKATLFDKLRLAVAVYRQNYNNLASQPSSGLERQAAVVGDPLSAQTLRLNGSYWIPVKAKVDGFDLDMGLNVTPNWTVNAGVSWAKAKFSENRIGCFDSNFDGVPDPSNTAAATAILTAGTPQNAAMIAELASRNIAFQTCNVATGFVDLANPSWSATMRTEWHHEVMPGIEAFVTGSMQYRPKNDRNPAFTVENYALVDFSLGARNREQGWEAQVFVKNLFNNRTVTAQSTTDASAGLTNGTLFTPVGSVTPSGYRTASYLAPREVGLTVRYSFGSK